MTELYSRSLTDAEALSQLHAQISSPNPDVNVLDSILSSVSRSRTPVSGTPRQDSIAFQGRCFSLPSLTRNPSSALLSTLRRAVPTLLHGSLPSQTSAGLFTAKWLLERDANAGNAPDTAEIADLCRAAVDAVVAHPTDVMVARHAVEAVRIVARDAGIICSRDIEAAAETAESWLVPSPSAGSSFPSGIPTSTSSSGNLAAAIAISGAGAAGGVMASGGVTTVVLPNSGIPTVQKCTGMLIIGAIGESCPTVLVRMPLFQAFVCDDIVAALSSPSTALRLCAVHTLATVGQICASRRGAVQTLLGRVVEACISIINVPSQTPEALHGALASLMVLLDNAREYFDDQHTYIVPICKALLSQSNMTKALQKSYSVAPPTNISAAGTASSSSLSSASTTSVSPTNTIGSVASSQQLEMSASRQEMSLVPAGVAENLCCTGTCRNFVRVLVMKIFSVIANVAQDEFINSGAGFAAATMLLQIMIAIPPADREELFPLYREFVHIVPECVAMGKIDIHKHLSDLFSCERVQAVPSHRRTDSQNPKELNNGNSNGSGVILPSYRGIETPPPALSANALLCLLELVVSVGSTEIVQHSKTVLKNLSQSPVSPAMLELLTTACTKYPEETVLVQEPLFNIINAVLTQDDHEILADGDSEVAARRERLVIAVLRTLAVIGCGSSQYLEFVQSVVCARYLTHQSSEIRQQTASTALAVLATSFPQSGAVIPSRGYASSLVSSIFSTLMDTAVTTEDTSLRLCIISSLGPQFDYYFLQPEHLSALIMLSTDTSSAEVRVAVLHILSRLMPDNSTTIQPVMRRLLFDLLCALDCFNRSIQPSHAVLPIAGSQQSPGIEGQPVPEPAVDSAQKSTLQVSPPDPVSNGGKAGTGLMDSVFSLEEDVLDSIAEKRMLNTELLTVLVEDAPSLVQHYADSFFPTLLPQVTQSYDVTLSTLSTCAVGAFVLTEPKGLQKYVHTLIVVLLELVSGTSPAREYVQRREAALEALGNIFRVAGTTVRWTDRYPGLMRALVSKLNTDSSKSVRVRVITLIGILGAINPYLYTQLALRMSRDGDSFNGPNVNPAGATDAALVRLKHAQVEVDDDDSTPNPLASSGGNDGDSEDEEENISRSKLAKIQLAAAPDLSALRIESSRSQYHDIMTVHALLEILFDPSLQSLQKAAIAAVAQIVKQLGDAAVPYLNGFLPPILSLADRCPGIRDACLTIVGSTAVVAKAHMIAYIPRIEYLLLHYWDSNTLMSCLYVLECTTRAVSDSIAMILPRLLPKLLFSFEMELRRRTLNVPLLKRFLETINVVGIHLRDHAHMVLPSIINLFESASTPASLAVAAISAIARIAKVVDISCNIGSVMHAILVVTDRHTPVLLQQLNNGTNNVTSEFRDAKYVVDTVRDALLLLCLSVPRSFAPFIPIVNSRFDKLVKCCPLRQDYRDVSALVFKQHQAGVCPPKPSLEMLVFFPQYTTEELFRARITQLTVVAPSSSGGSTVTVVTGQSQHHSQGRNGHRGSSSQGSVNIKLEDIPSTDHLQTEDDIQQWFYEFTLMLVRKSPSEAVRMTAPVVQACQPLGKKMFPQAFLALWNALDTSSMNEMRKVIASVLQHPETPTIVMQELLNLFEFLEREEKPIIYEDLLRLAQNGDVKAKALLVPAQVVRSGNMHSFSHSRSASLFSSSSSSSSQPFLRYSDLASAAFRCHAYAKALRVKEKDYKLAMAHPSASTEHVLEDLISINNELQLPDASNGVLLQAQMHSVVLHENWFEKLDRWSEALSVHRKKLDEDPGNSGALLGTLRCLNALGEYNDVDTVVRRAWHGVEQDEVRQQMAPIACYTAMLLGNWDRLQLYAEHIPEHTTTRSIYETVLALHAGDFETARKMVNIARDNLDNELVGVIGESYARAYPHIVKAQQLAELEEVCDYKATHDIRRRKHILSLFSQRLYNTSYQIDTWQTLLRTQALAVEPKQNPSVWIHYAALCRKQGRLRLARSALESLVGFPLSMLDPISKDVSSPRSTSDESLQQQRKEAEDKLLDCGQPNVAFACAKLMWSCARDIGEYREALAFLCRLRGSLSSSMAPRTAGAIDPVQQQQQQLLASVHLKTGYWQLALSQMHTQTVSMKAAEDMLKSFRAALRCNDKTYKTWHAWAMINVTFVSFYEKNPDLRQPFLVAALEALFQSMVFGTNNVLKSDMDSETTSVPNNDESETTLQDALAFLKLTYNHCTTPQVEDAVLRVVEKIDVSSWLNVIPQIIARISSRNPRLRKLTNLLLCKIGCVHPQAIVYPLNVLRSTTSHDAAEAVFSAIRPVAGALEEQVHKFAHELLMLGIFWQEMWLFGINEASRLCYDLGDFEEMWKVFNVMYGFLVKTPKTLPDQSFASRFRSELLAALESVKEYKEKRDFNYLQAAWDRWFHVFRAIEALNNDMTSIDLATVIPELLSLRNLTLCVPGTYTTAVAHRQQHLQQLQRLQQQQRQEQQQQQLQRQQQLDYGGYIASMQDSRDNTYQQQQKRRQLQQQQERSLLQQQLQYSTHQSELVTIARIKRRVKVYRSKQRPRALTIVGSNGVEYQFLLKGHEDLRQDERAMQFFGLVNSVLMHSRACARDHLKIVTYSIVPLSPNAGLIGWVLHSDTFHELVKEYREWKGIPINRESSMMREMTPFCETLTLMQKVELFREVLARTDGMDMRNVLWRRSVNTEQWLQQRLAYTRSLAVMSMVGHILGIGDRHPSNLMLDRDTGDVTHIDFGDCFEIAMKRSAYPEHIPFRLTRMLVNVMEASGIEGTFRATCERVMALLRKNKDTLLTVLETFVYDPLITWKLLDDAAAAGTGSGKQVLSKKDNPLSCFVNEDSIRTWRESQAGGENFVMHVVETPQNSLFRQVPGELGDKTPKMARLRRASMAGDDIATLLLQIGPSLGARVAQNQVQSSGLRNKAQIVPVRAAPVVKVPQQQQRHQSPSEQHHKNDESEGDDDDGDDDDEEEDTDDDDDVIVEQGHIGEEKVEEEVMNSRALHVMKKVVRKLEGTEFGRTMDVQAQVEYLFREAMNEENLAACYRGWCPFW